MMDLPTSAACSIPIGVKEIPWLIALFKNNTFAGSIKIAAVEEGYDLQVPEHHSTNTTSTAHERPDCIVTNDG